MGATQEVIKFLQNWQTLSAGLLAFFGAAVTVFFISRQIKQADQHFKDACSRKYRVARATLPAALAELMHYSKECAQIANALRIQLLPENRQNIFTAQVWETPLVPQGAIEVLKNCIEHAESDVAERLSDILSDLQIFRDRFLSFDERLRELMFQDDNQKVKSRDAEDQIFDAAKLYAEFGLLLPYARREEEFSQMQCSKKNIMSALNLMHIEHSNLSYVFQTRVSKLK